MAETFGKRLANLRKEQGLTQAMLGQKLGRGDSTVRMWELDKNQPNHEYLLRLADIFEVSVDYLLGQKQKGSPLKSDRPDLQKLMDLAANASDEDLAALLRMAQGFLHK